MTVFAKLRVLVLALALTGCDSMSDSDVAANPRDRAEQMIAKALSARGSSMDGLPATNVAAVGPLSFRFDPQRNEIITAVLVKEFIGWTTFPEDRPKLEQVVAGVKNPAIGGMFQTDGAAWMFDEDDGKLRLGYTHPVTASADDLIAAANKLENIYPDWSISWMPAISAIVHRGAPVPTQKVTVDNNPYR